MRKTISTSAFLFITAFVYAQNNSGLKGLISDGSSKPVPAATILLKHLPDSALVSSAFTDKEGAFNFSNIQAGSYCIVVNSISHKPSTAGPYRLQGGIADAGKLTLVPISRNLADVKVSAKKPFIEVKAGKVILNVSQSITSAGNNAFDILKKAPGIIADESGNLKLNGREGVQILIDGKQSYLSGEDLTSFLQSMQSSSIEFIELISNPGVSYSAAGSAGLINIRLIKDKNIGSNGTLSLSSGLSKLGASHRPNFRAIPSLTVHSRTRQVNVFGNYSFADVEQSRRSLLTRNIVNANQVSSIDVDYFTRTHRFSHSYRGGADYFLNPRNTIGLMVSGADTRLNIDKRNQSDIWSGGSPESTIKASSDQERNIHNINFNLSYKALLGAKKNELSADADLAVYRRTSLEDMYLDYQYFQMKTKMMMPSNMQLMNSSPAKYNIKSAKVDYMMPLSASDKITAGAKSSSVISNSNLDFGRITDAGYVPNTMFTNQFHFNELINSLYLNYSHATKGITFQAGLRAEHTTSKGNSLTGGNIISKKYLNFFPNVSFSKNLNQSNELSLSYSRRLDRPAYQDLNPFLGYLDQYSYSSGNPLLSPQYSNNLEATHIFKKQFSTTLRYSLTRDAFSSVYKQNSASRMVIQSRQNLDQMQAWGMVLNAPFEIASWWTSNMNISAMNIHYKSSSDGGTLNNGKPDITIKALQALSFHNGLSAEINAKYQSPSFYGIMNYSEIFNLDLGVSKSLFNKHGSLKLSAIDIFNSDHTAFYSNYQNLDMYGDDKPESRMAVLSFNWTFGKTTVGSFRKQNGSSEAEQSRVGNL